MHIRKFGFSHVCYVYIYMFENKIKYEKESKGERYINLFRLCSFRVIYVLYLKRNGKHLRVLILHTAALYLHSKVTHIKLTMNNVSTRSKPWSWFYTLLCNSADRSILVWLLDTPECHASANFCAEQNKRTIDYGNSAWIKQQRSNGDNFFYLCERKYNL